MKRVASPMKITGRRGGLFLAAALFMLPLVPAASAQESTGALAQGFRADNGRGTIIGGTLVSQKSGDAKAVELAATDSAARLVGVADQNPLVVISGADTEATIVLNGTTSVLVSDLDGPIKAGDKITVSPIAGVGMLATVDSQVVGTALADFDTRGAQSRTIQDTRGQDHTVHIGLVPLRVGVDYYQAPGSNFLPPFVQRLANSIAGRPVSLIRILFCTFILLLSLISITVLIYTSARSAMTSIGRNPLAAAAIRKGLFQVVFVAIVVLAAGVLASYIILTL